MKKCISILVLILLYSINSFAQTLSESNFIYTAAPQKAVKAVNYNTLSKGDIQQSVTYFDGLGRPIQSIGIGQGSNKVSNNLLDWKNTWTNGTGSVPLFTENGKISENVRINGIGPFGKNSLLWQCVNDEANDDDGGWNSASIAIDKNVAYRYAVWVKRTGSQNGLTFHGTQSVVGLDGSTGSRYCFWYGNLPALDTWYLMVGMIQPASYTGGYSGISGVYDTAGNKVISGTDFKWHSMATTANFSSYLNYATDLNTSQYFYNPTVQKIDGTEASVSGLSADFAASDIVTHMEYDGFGRQDKEYLPYAVTNEGNEFLKTDALSATMAFYNQTKYENTANPFSQKQFELSPLNRVLQQTAPGNDWTMVNNHTIKMDYQTNGPNEVKLYTVTTVLDEAGVYAPTISSSGYYVQNQLYKTITKDENWTATEGSNKTTEDYKDKEGHIVLKKTYNLGVAYETYYVYDMYDNLSFVLPPKAEGVITVSVLDDLCYQYKYDSKNRLIEKKLPGKDWEYIVYDKLDRPILTQDANLRTAKKWMFIKYDIFNRPIYTGEYVNAVSITRADVQAEANVVMTLFETKQGSSTINGTTTYYSNNVFPNIGIDLFTINYYDDYNFDLNGGVVEAAYGIMPTTSVKSLTTGNKVRILGTSSWTTNVIYYDVKGRPIYNYSKNDYLGITAKVKSQLDFVGKTIETTSSNTRSAVTTSIVDTFVYDHVGRLLSQKQKINALADEIIVSNSYDELGQLVSKGVGGKMIQNRLQTVDYTYNIRGWLKEINNVGAIGNDLFAFKINYNSTVAGVAPLYNGNISQIQWKTANDPLANTPRNYSYTYDALNRLTMAKDNTSLTPNRYNESLSYDKNGNIMSVLRLGNTDVAATAFGTMDNLAYTYDAGNKLTKVEDSGSTEGFNNGSIATTEYSYDDNGNMKTDLNKGISAIAYNYLNLPTQITIGGNNVNYVYDATGAKQQKIVNSITTDYAGGFIYENNVMKFFSQPEGYVANNAGVFSYIYQYKDHLGNVRLSYGDGNNDGVVNSSEIVEENNYYPFGLKHKGYNNIIGSFGDATAQKYKFNGKELQDELGLGIYFFKFRTYDPALGRFWQIDPLAGTYAHNSTYAFAENNVSSGTDLEGLELSFHLNGNLATGQNGPRVTGGVNGNYTLQELKSHMAQKQAQEDRDINKLMLGDPRSLPRGDIRPAKGDINVARFDDPGMMMADGARIGAEMMATDIAIGKVFQGLGALGKGESVWMANALERGRRIEKTLGENLGWNFPTIDKVKDGVATSIKSLDLTAGTYQKGNNVLNTLKGYINKLDNFTSATWGGQTVTEGVSYTSKSLELAVQTGKGTESQWSQIGDAIKYAQDKNINVTIRFIK
jgi:RHS repeat-associated protein